MERTGLLLVLALISAGAAAADTVVAARTLRAESLIGPADLRLIDETTPGALTRAEDAVGLETRRNVYAGQVLRAPDLGPPAIVLRNDIVVLSYFRSGVAIQTEGRAMGRGGVGDRLRVMNLASRSAVTGTVLPDGSVEVAGPR
ncbi:MAG: flagellar basal body P-ring formation chaperone FlgA [Pseudomonadota bacterium]